MRNVFGLVLLGSSPALACGTCSFSALWYRLPAMHWWLYAGLVYWVLQLILRSRDGSLQQGQILSSAIWVMFCLVSGAMMLGPMPFAILVGSWWVSSMTASSPQRRKLDMALVGFLLVSGVWGYAQDNWERRFGRLGGSARQGVTFELAKEGVIPREQAEQWTRSSNHWRAESARGYLLQLDRNAEKKK